MSDKKDKNMDSIKEKIEELQGDIDFIYNLIQPELPEVSEEHEYHNDSTLEISEDLYKILYEYCENKKFIFMGVC